MKCPVMGGPSGNLVRGAEVPCLPGVELRFLSGEVGQPASPPDFSGAGLPCTLDREEMGVPPPQLILPVCPLECERLPDPAMSDPVCALGAQPLARRLGGAFRRLS